MSAAVKPSKWRESNVLQAGERAIHRARRKGYRLEVTVCKAEHPNERARGEFRVVADVDDPSQMLPVAFMVWPLESMDQERVDAAIAVAKRWAELEADRIAAGNQ